MKCPDCGASLVEVSLSGVDKSYRCFKCGGVWILTHVVNKLPDADVTRWKPIMFDPAILTGGDHKCPTDGTQLQVYVGPQVPEDIVISHCPTCKWWWFPNDTLFRFKPHQSQQIKKLSGLTGMAAAVAAVALPILSIAVIMGGLGAGTKLTQQEQQVVVPAYEGVGQIQVTYEGEGQATVRFKSQQIFEYIEFRRKGADNWTIAGVSRVGDMNSATLVGLVEEQTYEVRIADKIEMFNTNVI